MIGGATSRIVIVLAVVLVAVAGLAAFYLFRGAERGGPGTTSGTASGPYVSSIEIERYFYEDGELYMRLKMTGQVDLRDPIDINGAYGSWFGRVTVRLPDGNEGALLKSEDHSEFFTQFLQIPGTITVDLRLPTEWYERHYLEGAYTVSVWLKGPYENRVVLCENVFNLTMALNATISPTAWRSWEENVSITVTNTGDLPLILQSISMEMPETGTVIGWIYAQTMEPLVVMPSETKTWSGKSTMAGYAREIVGEKRFRWISF